MDISSSIEQAISSYINQWLAQHAYLAWLISHPLPSLGLLLLAIFSLWGLFKAIGRGIEQIWLFLLKTPFKLLQPIFGLIWSWVLRISGYTNRGASQLTTQLVQNRTPERIDWIIDRLQLLSQEQSQLLQELSRLRNPSVSQSELDRRSDTQY